MSQRRYDLSVHLLDADGTVYNEFYSEHSSSSEEERVIASNPNLIDGMVEDIRAAGQGQIESFSLRQNPVFDHKNSVKNKTSLFSEGLGILHREVQRRLGSDRYPCKLDKHLLWDTCYGQIAGTAFDRKVVPDEKGQYSLTDSCIVDPSKIMTLYVKMQRVVAENPDKQNIKITVWEDSKDIVDTLHAFFSAHPDLVPQQVTLQLKYQHRYDSHHESLPIVGQGELNADYGETLKKVYREVDFFTLIRQYTQGNTVQSFRNTADSLAKLSEVHENRVRDHVAKADNARIFELGRTKRIKTPRLMNTMLDRMEAAKTLQEIMDMITLFCANENRSVLARTSTWKDSVHHWQGHFVSKALSDFIHLAKRKALDMYMQDPQKYTDCMKRLSTFLNTHRVGYLGKTGAYSLFNKFNKASEAEKANTKKAVQEDYQTLYKAFKKQYGSAG